MGKVFVLLVLVGILVFIFLASDTWQSRQKIEMRDGLEYVVTEHSLKWSNFLDYSAKIPSLIRKNIKTLRYRFRI
jgi:hypothetical protein